jgi:hypothetical protein
MWRIRRCSRPCPREAERIHTGRDHLFLAGGRRHLAGHLVDGFLALVVRVLVVVVVFVIVCKRQASG